MLKNKKIPYLNLIPILIISFLLFKVIDNVEFLAEGFGLLLSILTPFFWAFGIAYLLNPLMVHLEKRFKLKRGISLLIVYAVVIGFITLSVTIISPTIASNIGDLANNIPEYAIKTEAWIRTNIQKLNLNNNKDIISWINNLLSTSSGKLTEILNTGVNTIFTKAVSFTSSFLKMIFGFIISVYILNDKELFKNTIKRFLYAAFNTKSVDNFLIFTDEVNRLFSQYIIGKFIDSLIIGILCAIGLTILKAPYALLISIIVGITNMIPYFGPFIGMIPAVIITVFFSPIKALEVLIFIIILQQFDGWFLGPKILGDKVGLNPFLIILAITIGGGTFGVLGMFLGVPVMAVIKTFLQRYMTKRLEEKNIQENVK
ncbi:AI-2E family transporter [Clostridium sp. MB40-C1]|uniref:AI-2E family transporter n=1 Tax=Clostridium sp. MB40-C1 TaxID=3070996 RepID=UPI0027DEE3C2|nr:AI-2E family transporter [Clostridium sp. MB40-C1]WMJ81075.1 AI-2E family transporter [Clostridium sp. MB40-C1]